MPRPIDVGENELAYLRNAVESKTTYQRMADEIGCCVDTVKRILQRHDIAQFDGAKYAVPVETLVQTWTRACSDCGCEKPRPKWQYRCDPCKEGRQRSAHLPDEWL